MKMNREQLKDLIKECLVEVLTEGLGTSGGSALAEAARRPARRSSGIVGPPRPPALAGGRVPTAALREAVKREAGGNPVLADILSDTAAKTLPNMLAGETKAQAVSGGIAEQIVANTTPDQLFGEESASRWANLAFMDAPKKPA